MQSLRLRNYRCFADTGEITFKPINILLGANSAGKSSFLKFFPLLKQSLARTTNGLFLWYDRDVDFKDFANTVRRGQDELQIEVRFPLMAINDGREIIYATVNLVLAERSGNSHLDYLKRIEIQFNEAFIEIGFKDKLKETDKIEFLRINGNDFITQVSHNLVFDSDFLPNILFKRRDDESYTIKPEWAEKDMYNLLSRHFGATPEGANSLIYNFSPLTQKQLDNKVRNILGDDFYNKSKVSVPLSIYLLIHLNAIINLVSLFFRGQASKIYYVQPLRAQAQRYYRIQNLAVDELDSHGDNLAMYINNLSEPRKNALNDWLEKSFNFRINTRGGEGHIEIIITDTLSGKESNIIDTGFGYSQLLPIIIQVWDAVFLSRSRGRVARYPGSKNLPVFIAIEQPELHLHPRLIAKFIRMVGAMVEFGKSKKIDVRFLIETHSKTLIETLGQMITEKNADGVSALSPDDAQVLIFNAHEEGLEGEIAVSHFDSDGYLDQWPFGFFEPD